MKFLPFPKNYVVWLLINLSLASCISLQVGSSKANDPDYSFPAPTTDWRQIELSKSSLSFRSSSGSVLGLSSACDGAIDTEFAKLLQSVFASLREPQILVPQTEMLKTPIPGYWSRVRGKVDRQTMEIVAIVMKSKTCVYDVTLAGKNLATSEVDEAIRLAQNMQATQDK